jgi:hypothetical protein
MSTRAITIAGFAAVITALIVLEIVGRRPASRIPTLGEWLGYVMRPRSGRALVLLGWLWLGWHYFARLTVLPIPGRRAKDHSGQERPSLSGLPGTYPGASFR